MVGSRREYYCEPPARYVAFGKTPRFVVHLPCSPRFQKALTAIGQTGLHPITLSPPRHQAVFATDAVTLRFRSFGLEILEMTENYIRRFAVRNLWGHRHYDIPFDDDVNVIIGPNASGKTTIINIIYDSIAGNLSRLAQTHFDEVIINLRSFHGDIEHELQILRSEEALVFRLDGEQCRIPVPPLAQIRDELRYEDFPIMRYIPPSRRMVLRNLQDEIRQLVPAVWLPVSRRLPMAEDEEIERRARRRIPLESVDECLSGVIDALQRYRQSLNAELSELRRKFQWYALENILYDKQLDGDFPRLPSFLPPSADDEQSLIKAFRDVGLDNEAIMGRITEHFAAARRAYSNLNSKKPEIGAVFIIPLINRTRSIAQFAQNLENQRENLFASLHAFEDIVNSFFNEKRIQITEQGVLEVIPSRRGAEAIGWRDLSSGEKQILILLIQALLSERAPMVYVADEPELSLHVTWQEKLLKALTDLAGRCQFIVATHSPDIVAGFGKKVIDLAQIGK